MALVTKNFTQVPNEVIQLKKLNLKAIGLYTYLKYRSYAGNAEKAYFPSQKTIMNDLKIGSSNTLKKILDELVIHGFLRIKKGSIYTGNSVYKLLVPKNEDQSINSS